MRHLITPLIICAALYGVACNPAAPTENTSAPTNSTNATSTTTNAPATTATPTTGVPPISSAHGGDTAAPAAPASANEKPEGVDTAALDAKIAKAEAKAKAPNATESDRLAAAAAYKERADIYMNAGRPNLYKFALGDYRRVLRYQPNNEDAQKNIDMLISIYHQLNKPVPTNGLEQ